MHTGVELDMQALLGEGQPVRGIKGEMDAALLDESRTCVGVVEMKLGGKEPYGAIYNDLRKLMRMMALSSGKQVRPHSAAATFT
jgi:hypothetical protein